MFPVAEARVPRPHRIVAYFKESDAEAGISYSLPWRDAGVISEIIGASTTESDVWLSPAQASALLRSRAVRHDPASYDWCLQLSDAG